MRAIITITEYPSMPGRYRWSVQANGRTYTGEAGWGAEAAAASAMEAAIAYGRGGYVVFAPSSVLKLIPDDMRSRA